MINLMAEDKDSERGLCPERALQIANNWNYPFSACCQIFSVYGLIQYFSNSV